MFNGQNPALEDAVAAVIDALRAPDSDAASFAADAIQKLSPLSLNHSECLIALADALRNREFNIRFVAVLTLDALGCQTHGVVSALVAALKDLQHKVRWAAAVALGSIGPEDSGCVEALVAALQDEHMHVRYAAAISLITIAPDDLDQASEVLIEALSSSENTWRNRASETLTSIGFRVTRILRQALSGPDSHPNEFLKQEAIHVLQAINRELNTFDLIEALNHPSSDLRWEAVKALGMKMGRGAGVTPEIVSALVSASTDADPRVRLHTVRLLGRVGPDKKAALAIENAVNDSDLSVSQVATISLKWIKAEIKAESLATASLATATIASRPAVASDLLRKYLSEPPPRGLPAPGKITKSIDRKGTRDPRKMGPQAPFRELAGAS
jgi:HEAT repeat protein